MHLVDVNVWLALAFRQHVHHVSAAKWFSMAPGTSYFCRFTQIGFLRLATNPAATGRVAVGMTDAWSAYDLLSADPQVEFAIEPDGIESVFRDFAKGTQLSPKLWNDAYLAAFAKLADYEIVTFDQGFSQFAQVKCTLLR